MARKGPKKGRSFEVPAGAVYALLAAITLICITVVTVAIADDGGSNGGGERRRVSGSSDAIATSASGPPNRELPRTAC